MKREIKLVSIFLLIFLSACDPTVPGEGINLPSMEFAFEVSPDTAFMKVGDTFSIHASVNSTLSNGIKLTDGEGELWFGISKSDSIPMISINDNVIPLNNIDYKLIIVDGGVKWANDDPNRLFRLTLFPSADSITMSYKFVFLKKGLYQIGGFQSSFYEGSKGKTRCYAHYDVHDPHWYLVNIPDYPAPQPGEYGYKENYLIAVID